MISHWEEGDKITILPYLAVKKVTVKEECRSQRGINRCWYLVTSGRRTPEGERERSQMIGWDPKTEVGLPSPQRK